MRPYGTDEISVYEIWTSIGHEKTQMTDAAL